MQGRLEAHEARILQRSPQVASSHDQALKSQFSFTGGRGSYSGLGRGREQGRGGRQTKKYEEQKRRKETAFQQFSKRKRTNKTGHKINEFWEKYPEKRREAGLVHENHESGNSETLLIASDEKVSNIWYLDSGASRHMTGNKSLFSTLVQANHGHVTIGDAKSYKIEGFGEISFKAKNGKIEKIYEVYYVPGLQSNLLSVGHLLKKKVRYSLC